MKPQATRTDFVLMLFVPVVAILGVYSVMGATVWLLPVLLILSAVWFLFAFGVALLLAERRRPKR